MVAHETEIKKMTDHICVIIKQSVEKNEADQLTTFPAKIDFYLRCLPGAGWGSNRYIGTVQ